MLESFRYKRYTKNRSSHGDSIPKKYRIERSDYRPVIEFSRREGISEEDVVERVRMGYYQGRLFEGQWYIHNEEFKSECEIAS